MTGKVLGYPLAVFLVALVMDGASPLITQAQPRPLIAHR